MELIQCKGCNLNTNHNNQTCLQKININKILRCEYLNKKTNINLDKIIIPSNIHTIENTIRDNLILYTHKKKINKDSNRILIDIDNPEINQINKTIRSEEHITEISTIYLKNRDKEREQMHNHSSYEFYTDGLLLNRGQQNITMGTAWIQTKGSNPGSEFLTGVKNWPSST